jgi:hypothetical protein
MIQDELKQAMGREADRLQPQKDLARTIIVRGRRVRRTRRVGLGVAVVSGIVAAAVLPGTLIQSGVPDPAWTPTASPKTPVADPPYATLPKGAAPRLPYTAGTRDGGWLYDADTRVRLARGQRLHVVGRVDGGWFVTRDNQRGGGDLGILSRSGTFTALGTSAGNYWAISPDRRYVAFGAVDRHRRFRVAVFDVSTGRRTASTTIERHTEITGWNSHGIWYVTSVPGGQRQSRLRVWQPGGKPRLVPDGGYVVVERHPARMIRIADSECVEVVVLGSAGRLETLRRYCGPGISGGDLATLSPDGKVIVLPDGTARPVDGGPVVRVRQNVMLPPEPMSWEDDTHVLLYDKENVRRIRCDVRTGRCERVDTGFGDIAKGEYASIAYR